MKKLVCLALVLALMAAVILFSCAACGRTKASTGIPADTPDVTFVPTPAPTVTPVYTEAPRVIHFNDADCETSSYSYTNEKGKTTYIITIKNNSEFATCVIISVKVKDASGNILDSIGDTIDVLGPGETSFVDFYLEIPDGATVEMERIYTPDFGDNPVVKDISYTKVLNKDNAVITVTNNGYWNAMFLEGIAIFLDASDNVVDDDTETFQSEGGALRPGESLSKMFYTDKDYDHVDFYLNGYTDGSAYALRPITDGYDVTEYMYRTESGTIDYIAIKNNTEERACIYGYALAKDASGTIVDTADMYIDLAGPGETQLGFFTFKTKAEIATVEYQLYRDMDIYYKSGLPDFSVTVVENDDNIILTATNNTQADVLFANATCLYFDKDNKVVDTDKVFFMGRNFAIAPGATIGKIVSTDKDYAYALIFPNVDLPGELRTVNVDYTPTINPKYQEADSVLAVGDVPPEVRHK